jgi:hypothetical protein
MDYLETQYKLFSYVIECKDYLKFKDQLNKKRQTITRISPTFVAGRMSDSFVIDAICTEKKIKQIHHRKRSAE